ncbi:hypothetical protein EOM86_14690 [Candidatus Nomurabacteria bacterium]|nr:hypothetical protein [Candidatus Nomurabacteria bacterium]
MISNYLLTTIDNPYDPFDQFDLWFMFDTEKGYDSCGYLGRIARTSSAFSEDENEEEIERAIDEIIKYDFRQIHKKVRKEVDETNEKET